MNKEWRHHATAALLDKSIHILFSGNGIERILTLLEGGELFFIIKSTLNSQIAFYLCRPVIHI
ncbi:hypothetical protein D770_01270 [Flammeovirgaceae bacterium 311]|nr:hypothetical protein D770_01270 [Flammeovirgaceae bacterium 311]